MNQVKLNEEIKRFIEEMDAKHADYSAADIAFINQYEGSGGQGSKGATGEGLLYEFYTPEYLVDYLYEFAVKYGYKGGPILEPSCGTGRMIWPANKYTKTGDYTPVTAFEINPISARIAEINCPEAEIITGYFETAFLEPPRFTTLMKGKKLTWLDTAGGQHLENTFPFELVIGNPPYGIHRNRYSSYFSKADKMSQIDFFFLRQSLKLCKPGGLVIFVTASNFLRSTDQTYGKDKLKVLEYGQLLDAYRLPKVFKYSSVPTDILIFQRTDQQ